MHHKHLKGPRVAKDKDRMTMQQQQAQSEERIRLRTKTHRYHQPSGKISSISSLILIFSKMGKKERKFPAQPYRNRNLALTSTHFRVA